MCRTDIAKRKLTNRTHEGSPFQIERVAKESYNESCEHAALWFWKLRIASSNPEAEPTSFRRSRTRISHTQDSQIRVSPTTQTRPLEAQTLRRYIPRKYLRRAFTVALEDVPEVYKTFVNNEDHCVKVLIDPWAQKAANNEVREPF
jgi:hypothetical protein